MSYENDPYRDEDGEPLMDYDDVLSDRGESPEPLLDDDAEEEWAERERSQTPVYDTDKVGKPKKRLVKKSVEESDAPDFDVELADFGGDYESDGEGDSVQKKRKSLGKEGGNRNKQKKLKKEKRHGGERSSKSGLPKKGMKGYSGQSRDHDGDAEVKEMWDTIAGGDYEDDQERASNVDDDNFIDDSGMDPADRYGSDNEPPRSPRMEVGEVDDEIKQLFNIGKKKKKVEKSAAEIALLVENVMAELEIAAEEDAKLNMQSKPAVNKLKKLPLLTEVLSKKQLQQEFLDHAVLTLLKNWLEPLPDNSLPNINIREAVLKILTDFPIDLEQHHRRDQLKKSGLGKVIMFLSKTDEETTSNRKLAKDLVDKWSRPIFNKSTRFEDMRNYDEDNRVPFRRQPVKKPATKSARMDSRDDDLDLARRSQESRSGQHPRVPIVRPEATPMDFVVRPQSKIDPDEIRARAKQVMQDEHRMKMNKKLQQLKAPKKKQLQATRLSVEGRGMVKYL